MDTFIADIFSRFELSDETLNKSLNEMTLWNHSNYNTNNRNPDQY